jgi:hypothetical protein
MWPRWIFISVAMKVIILFLAAIFVAHAQPRNQLINALIAVESRNNAAAIGDGGRAYGLLQIHAVMVADANRIAKTKYTHDDMFEPCKAREVAEIILTHYARHIERVSGVKATDEQLARIWNGGGSAWKLQREKKELNLQNYWRKVQSNL